MTDLLNYFPIEVVSFLPSALANVREIHLFKKKAIIIKWVLMVCSIVLPTVHDKPWTREQIHLYSIYILILKYVQRRGLMLYMLVTEIIDVVVVIRIRVIRFVVVVVVGLRK